MAFNGLFGFRFRSKKQEKEDSHKTQSFIPSTNEDGAITLEQLPSQFSYYGIYYDHSGVIQNEVQLIDKYREMSLYGEIDGAIDEIVNECIIGDKKEPPVSIELSENFKFSEDIKNKIRKEFSNILNLLNFNNQAYDIFRKWYIDGRLYYQLIIDKEKITDGIKELKYIDPRCIKKAVIIERKIDPKTGIEMIEEIEEHYIYNKNGIINQSSGINQVNNIKITPESIVFCHSGILNNDNTMVYSYLHKAIKPYNQLRIMEDSLVIYRLSRAPERRIFNIDVGNLPPTKAKQFVAEMMDMYRNKLIYDAQSGEVRDDRKHSTMLEDFWFPKTSEGRSSEVTTLPGAEHLDEIEDILYFQKKLYKSLNIPVSRLESDTGFSLGRSTEIIRDEIKFSKFVSRLRNRFSHLFDELLRRQLILKKIINEKDWNSIKENIYYNFISDSYFSELKQTEITKERLDVVDRAETYLDKYFSKNFIRKKFLRQTDLEIEEIENEIKESQKLENKETSVEPTSSEEELPKEEFIDEQSKKKI